MMNNRIKRVISVFLFVLCLSTLTPGLAKTHDCPQCGLMSRFVREYHNAIKIDNKTHRYYECEQYYCIVCKKYFSINKTRSRVKNHSYSAWRYNKSTGKDERTCMCSHKQTRTHQHDYNQEVTTWVGIGAYKVRVYELKCACGEKIPKN